MGENYNGDYINGFRHAQLISGNIKTSAMIRSDSNDEDEEDDFDGKLNSENFTKLCCIYFSILILYFIFVF